RRELTGLLLGDTETDAGGLHRLPLRFQSGGVRRSGQAGEIARGIEEGLLRGAGDDHVSGIVSHQRHVPLMMARLRAVMGFRPGVVMLAALSLRAALRRLLARGVVASARLRAGRRGASRRLLAGRVATGLSRWRRGAGSLPCRVTCRRRLARSVTAAGRRSARVSRRILARRVTALALRT